MEIDFNVDDSIVLNENYQAILALDVMLNNAKIPHETVRCFDGWQIIYPEDGSGLVMDAIEHYGSYGKERDLIEIMGLLTTEEEQYDSVVGNLTAENVFARIKAHWDKTNEVDGNYGKRN